MPWLPCPFGHGSLPFPEVGDDIANPCRHGHAPTGCTRRDRSATDPSLRRRRRLVASPSRLDRTSSANDVAPAPTRDVTLHRARPRTSASQPMCRRTITSVTSRVLTVKQLSHTFKTRPTYFNIGLCVFNFAFVKDANYCGGTDRSVQGD